MSEAIDAEIKKLSAERSRIIDLFAKTFLITNLDPEQSVQQVKDLVNKFTLCEQHYQDRDKICVNYFFRKNDMIMVTKDDWGNLIDAILDGSDTRAMKIIREVADKNQ